VTHHHAAVGADGPYPFSGSVAVRGITEEKPAAHGAVRYIERCRCGMERSYNVNQQFIELGVWEEGREQRRLREAQEVVAAHMAAEAAEVQPHLKAGLRLLREKRLLDGRRFSVRSHGKGVVLLWTAGVGHRSITLDELRHAARETHPDYWILLAAARIVLGLHPETDYREAE